MTQRQIQQTMDFILRSQADSVVRMQQWEEKRKKWNDDFEKKLASLHIEVRETSREVRALVRENREHRRRMRALEASDRRTKIRVRGIKDLLKLFSKRLDIHSNRIDRIERNGR